MLCCCLVRGMAIAQRWPLSKAVYLLDTNIVSELRRPKPDRAVLNWIREIPANRLFLSAVTVGEIQAGIELMRERDQVKAAELEIWLGRVMDGYGVLPMDAAAFQEWARVKHGKSDTLIEDAMIAATARVHRLTVATRNVRDFQEFDVDLVDPFRHA